MARIEVGTYGRGRARTATHSTCITVAELVPVGLVNGHFEIGVNSPLGQALTIESTIDWESWRPVSVLPDATGRQILREDVELGFKAYRAKIE